MKAQIIDDNIEFVTAYSGTYIIAVLTEDNKVIADNNDEVTIDIDDENIDKNNEKTEDIRDKVEESEEDGFLDVKKRRFK